MCLVAAKALALTDVMITSARVNLEMEPALFAKKAGHQLAVLERWFHRHSTASCNFAGNRDVVEVKDELNACVDALRPAAFVDCSSWVRHNSIAAVPPCATPGHPRHRTPGTVGMLPLLEARCGDRDLDRNLNGGFLGGSSRSATRHRDRSLRHSSTMAMQLQIGSYNPHLYPHPYRPSSAAE